MKRAERLEFWRTFNLCWETLGQQQKEIIQEAKGTGRELADILTADMIRSLMDELVDIGDVLEPYGLVDFEMGIWEEQIVYIFTVCLDLLA
jgi:hypothetical protein